MAEIYWQYLLYLVVWRSKNENVYGGFNRILLNLKLTYESSRRRVEVLDLNVGPKDGSITTNLHKEFRLSSIPPL